MDRETLQADVLVIGAGMSGIMAAIAASREGLKVKVVERTYFPGGQATSTLLSEMNGFTHKGQKIYGGISNELVDQLIKVGSAKHAYNVLLAPYSVKKVQSVKSDRLRYNPEMLKLLLDWFTERSDLRAFGGCRLQSVEEQKDGVRVVVESGFNTIEIFAPVLIDATGCAEVALRAGYETFRSDQDRELSTLIFRLGNTEYAQLESNISNEAIRAVVQRGFTEGVLPDRYLSIVPIPGTKDVSVDTTRVVVDEESPRDITHGIIESRNQIIKIIPFLKESIPGLKNATLSSVGSVLGVRNGRRIVGMAEITERDILSRRRYADSVAVGCAPMGIHDPVEDEIEWKGTGGVYQIPFSAMVPLQSRRILATGKCICCDKMASTSVRCIPVVMNTGEVAGYAAALSVHKQLPPVELKVEDLRGFLRSKGLNTG